MGIIPTRNRNYAKLLGLEMSNQLPYIMEFTDNSLRFIYGTTPTYTADSNTITSASIATGNLTLGTGTAHGWSVGDDVMLWFAIDKPLADEGGYRGMVLQCVSGTTGSTLVLGDEVGNATLGGSINLDGTELVFRIQKLSTAINSTNYPSTLPTVLKQLRCIQTDTSGIIVQNNLAPQQVTISTAPAGINDAQFSISAATFQDGPYKTMQPDTGTVSAFTGTITFTPASSTFVANDVGRHIRLFSEPPSWASGTTYSAGALVKYNGAYYSSTQSSNTGNTPGTTTYVAGVPTSFWTAVTNVQRWVWGKISAQAGTSCTVVLGTDLSNINGVPVGATNVIPSANGSTITQWQVGLWSPNDGYPINGTFHEGRLFLLGPVGNRWDASVSNNIFTFSITDQYGNVNDNNALGETLNSADVLFWARPDDRGIVCGAQRGEWLISASVEGDAMTPTNAKARRVTDYRCAAIDPVKAGQSLVFAQFYKKHLFEYLIDSFSNRFQGKPLNDMDMPLTKGNLAELAITLEPTPRVWMRNEDGSLVSCTYRRISRFITEAPLYDAMNPHSVGDGRIVETLVGSGNPGGGDTACNALLDPSVPPPDPSSDGDYLYMVTNDAPDTSGSFGNNRMIEVIRPQQEGDDFALGWYADQSPGQGKHLLGNSLTNGNVFCTTIGGLKGSDSQSSPPADIGQRATATPGSTIPNTPGATRAAALAILGDAVWFNAYSALTGLPRIANTTSGLTLSVWLNIDGFNSLVNSPFTGPSATGPLGSGSLIQGLLLSSLPTFIKNVSSPDNIIPAPSMGGLPCPIYITTGTGPLSSTYDPTNGFVIKCVGPGFASDGTTWLASGVTKYAKMVVVDPKYVTVHGSTGAIYAGAQISVAVPQDDNHPGVYPMTQNLLANLAFVSPKVNNSGGQGSVGTFLPIQGSAVTSGVVNAPAATLDNGWYHLMVSLLPYTGAGGGFALQMSVNDTVIINGNDTVSWISASTGVPGPDTTLRLANMTQWCIGGRSGFPTGTNTSGGQAQDPRPQGDGLVAAMTELWIAPVGLDLTSSTNRNKFHTTDVAGLTWAPVSLGAQGQTPTGSAPWVYCTGGPKVFHLNRARKNAALTVYNNFPDVDHQVANALDNQIYLDSYQPGPPT